MEDFLRKCQNLVGVPGALGSRDRRVGAPAEVLWDTPTTMDRFRRATFALDIHHSGNGKVETFTNALMWKS